MNLLFFAVVQLQSFELTRLTLQNYQLAKDISKQSENRIVSLVSRKKRSGVTL